MGWFVAPVADPEIRQGGFKVAMGEIFWGHAHFRWAFPLNRPLHHLCAVTNFVFYMIFIIGIEIGMKIFNSGSDQHKGKGHSSGM